MDEGDFVGVEGLAGEAVIAGFEDSSAVHGVGYDGEAQGGEVDAELVGAAGFGGKFNEGESCGGGGEVTIL
jgi:hypothetical protein